MAKLVLTNEEKCKSGPTIHSADGSSTVSYDTVRTGLKSTSLEDLASCVVCYSSGCESISVSPNEYVDDRIQEAISGLKSKLSSMECSGCGGNIDTETLKCNCCGRQYRLVAEND